MSGDAWYNAGRGMQNATGGTDQSPPCPMDLHRVMANNAQARYAYELAMRQGYSIEQCHIAVILYLAGVLDRNLDEAIKRQELAVENPKKARGIL